jgi:hypothetical protein
METINLSEKEKKVFEKYNLYLIAVLGDNGMGWNTYINYDDGIDYIDGPSPNGPNGYYDRGKELSSDDPGYNIIFEIAEKIIRDHQDNYYDYLDDDYARSGNVILNYNPENKTFKLGIDVYQRKTEESQNNKTFDEIIEQPLPWYYNNQERMYKKLNNDEYIQKLIDEHNGETEFEFNYNGYGDSGEIDSSLPYSDDILNIAYEIIDLFHGGWENNEGADGQIIIDFAKKEIRLYHEMHYEEPEYEHIVDIKIV